MAARKFTSTGLIAVEPPQPDGRRTDSISLAFEHTYAQSDAGTVSIASTDVAPYNLVISAIQSVRLLYLRVLSGGTVKVLITSAAGTFQALRVSDELLIHAPNTGDEMSAILVVGTGDIEYVVAGDAATPTAPTPFANAIMQVSSTSARQTDTTGAEQVLFQWRLRFDDLPAAAANIAARLTAASALVTGGTGTVRLRVGGTFGAVDGTAVLTNAGIVATTDTALEVTPATAAKPAAGQWVKITGQVDLGQKLTVDSPYAWFGGA